jgi:hypothetical protein
VRDWRINLIEAHRRLFHPPNDASDAAGFPKCGDGWRELLECACERVESVLAPSDKFCLVNIRQRFGVLRVYWTGKLSTTSESKILEAVALAEARSCCTCEHCGDEGALCQDGRILMTRCPEHTKGHAVEIQPGFENAHLVRRIVGGRSFVSCCRYDRATDAFLEILPNSPIIHQQLNEASSPLRIEIDQPSQAFDSRDLLDRGSCNNNRLQEVVRSIDQTSNLIELSRITASSDGVEDAIKPTLRRSPNAEKK